MPDLEVHRELMERAVCDPVADDLYRLNIPITFPQFKRRYEVVEVPAGDRVEYHVQLKEPLHQGYRVCSNQAEVAWQLRNNYLAYLALYFRIRRVRQPMRYRDFAEHAYS